MTSGNYDVVVSVGVTHSLGACGHPRPPGVRWAIDRWRRFMGRK
jgi:hypothetical protein